MTKTPAKSKTPRRRAVALPVQLSPSMFQPSSIQRPGTPGLFRTILNWIERRRSGSSGPRLRVTETISLGEKRFVSVVHVDGQRFLIGGSASNVALLTQLDTQGAAFQTVLRKSAGTRKRLPARSKPVTS